MATSGGKFRSGKTGRTTVNAQTIKNNEWDVTYRGADLDTTNFESNGYEEGLTGLIGADWTIKGDWDAGVNPYDNPPGLYPRDDGVNMVLYPKVADNKPFTFPLWRCDSTRVGVRTDGKVTFDASGKSQGSFSIPTGSV